MATSVETRLNQLEGAAAELQNAVGCIQANQETLAERDELIAAEVEKLKDCEVCGLEDGDCVPNGTYVYVANPFSQGAAPTGAEIMAEAMATLEPDAYLIPSDNTLSVAGSVSGLNAALLPWQDAIDAKKFFPTLVENDAAGDSDASNFRGKFSSYLGNSFHYAQPFHRDKVLFISYCSTYFGGFPLDPDNRDIGSDQYDWLRETIRNYPGYFVILSQSLVPRSTSLYSGVDYDLKPETLGIKLVIGGIAYLSGDHLLVRGTHYVSLGGGGGPADAGGATVNGEVDTDTHIIWQAPYGSYFAKISAREFDVLVQVYDVNDLDTVVHELRIPR
jgi:hypothetical protein